MADLFFTFNRYLKKRRVSINVMEANPSAEGHFGPAAGQGKVVLPQLTALFIVQVGDGSETFDTFAFLQKKLKNNRTFHKAACAHENTNKTLSNIKVESNKILLF